MISKIVKYTLATIATLLVLFFIVGFYIGYVRYQSNADADAIRNIRLAYDDVDGTDLPPAPTEEEINASIGGPDKNNNTIRDDVELALFKLYPGKENEKIRAASLQYAQSQQIFLTKVYDGETEGAALDRFGNALGCIDDMIPMRVVDVKNKAEFNKAVGDNMKVTMKLQKEVETMVKNTQARIIKAKTVDKLYSSYKEKPNPNDCDIIGL